MWSYINMSISFYLIWCWNNTKHSNLCITLWIIKLYMSKTWTRSSTWKNQKTFIELFSWLWSRGIIEWTIANNINHVLSIMNIDQDATWNRSYKLLWLVFWDIILLIKNPSHEGFFKTQQQQWLFVVWRVTPYKNSIYKLIFLSNILLFLYYVLIS